MYHSAENSRRLLHAFKKERSINLLLNKINLTYTFNTKISKQNEEDFLTQFVRKIPFVKITQNFKFFKVSEENISETFSLY